MVDYNLTLTAQRRFGYGLEPDRWKGIASDPKAYVLAQLETPQQTDPTGLLATDDLLRQLRTYQLAVKAARETPGSASKMPTDERKDFKQITKWAEVSYRQRSDFATQTPFIERLCQFWSDHFCVSTAKNEEIEVIAGAYEREAIRPHVLGKFRDMLGAVMHHPAMLIYLDNNDSVGPTSLVGLKGKQGLNENLGRELLELHTLGVTAGYTQQDVTNTARIITGWGISDRKNPDGGRFEFKANRHEPGAFTVLGVAYAQTGVDQGEALLDALARHPATAQFLAKKLVRAFVGDHAPQILSDHVAATFQSTDGDLKAIARALVEHPAGWDTPATQVLPPYDWLIAATRMANHAVDPKQIFGISQQLGQPLWRPRQPNGFPMDDQAWAAPSSLIKRLDWAFNFAKGLGTIDPMPFAQSLFGPSLPNDLKIAISRAASRPEALATLLMSPEVQVR